MKLITEPKVYVVGQQNTGMEQLQTFLDDHDVSEWSTDTDVAGQALPEVAGRLCYMSYKRPRPGGNEGYLKHILEVGHGSVLEHAVWNLIITDVSRSLTHELVRHRVGFGYSQLSQRYVDESTAEFVVPADLQEEVSAALHSKLWCEGYMETSHESLAAAQIKFLEHHPMYSVSKIVAGERWIESMKRASADYVYLADYLNNKFATTDYERYLDHVSDGRDSPPMSFERWLTAERATANTQEDKTNRRKKARQAARSILPNATETKIFVTANARALRHFIELRCTRHAESEIRVLAHVVWKALVKEAPHLFGDYKPIILDDGTVELSTPYRKV